MSAALFDTDTMERWATFSPDRRYRWDLGRVWDEARGRVLFVGLNPSTAGASTDDPTIRRCTRFARDWGYGGFVMCNLFALISTDPRRLLTAEDAVGPHNDQTLREWAKWTDLTVACWGAFPQAKDRAKAVVESGRLGGFTVLGLTAKGHPKHPLYLRASCVPLNPLSLAPVEIPSTRLASPARTGGAG